MDALKKLYKIAYSHNNNKCGMLQDGYTIEDWVRLVFRKAKFFCLEQRFPSIDIWRDIDKEYDISQYRIFVEKGDLPILFEGSIDNCLLIGNVEYEIICDKLRPYRIIAMHGAKLTIRASNRAVITLETDGTCTVNEDISGGAILMRSW